MRRKTENELGELRRHIYAKERARPIFRPLPLGPDLTEEDGEPVPEEGLEDEKLASQLVEKSDKLDEILHTSEKTLKVVREIRVEVEKLNLEKELKGNEKRNKRNI
jgi:hypothetical protein